jgi:hypothetical protein
MDACVASGVDDYISGSGIGQREDAFIRPDILFPDIVPEPVGNLLRNKDCLTFLAAFRLPEYQLAILDIPGRKLQHLTDPHSPSGHQFHDQAIPGFGRSENDFIYLFFFQDVRQGIPSPPEQLPDHGSVAGVLNCIVKGVSDEIEKGLQAGITCPLCGSFCPLGDLVEERKDLVRRYRTDLPVTALVVKMGENELV